MEIFTENTQQLHLPRWEELPDIELYNDQVITLINKYMGALFDENNTPLTSSMINNYVKHGLIPCPVKKKYSRPHIARLIIICAMKPVLSIQSIGILIERLFMTGTEEEMLNCFADNYESAFSKITDTLNASFNELSGSENGTLPLAVIQAAAMSGGSSLIAEKALAKLAADEKNGDV